MENENSGSSFFRRNSDENKDNGASETRNSDFPKHFDNSPYEEKSESLGRKPLERRPYERKPFVERSYGGGERKSYGDRDGGERKSYGDRKPYGDRDGGERRSFGGGDRKPYGDRKPFGDREGGERKSYGDRKPYGDRDGGERRSFGDRKPFGGGDRKAFGDRNSFDKPMGKAPENLIFGVHPVREAIEGNVNIEKIYAKKDTEAIAGIIEFAEAKGIIVQYVPLEKLDYMTYRGSHQGIVAQLAAIEYADINTVLETLAESKRDGLFVVLDNITDVRNFGAIARTAECVGADAIIISAKNAAPVNAESIKSSAGALLKIPVCRVGSLRNTLKTMQLAGVTLVGATEKTNELLYESEVGTGSVAVILGSEDDGISTDILRLCDKKMSIPMLGKIESLNVSAAAAVMLYEVVRQRFNNVELDDSEFVVDTAVVPVGSEVAVETVVTDSAVTAAIAVEGEIVVE